MSKTAKQKLDEVEIAHEILNDPKATPQEIADANSVLKEDIETWDGVITDLDDILDIEDDDEREAAMNKYLGEENT